MSHYKKTPTLFLVIGANGAGKTTWCNPNRSRLPSHFYNADSIAQDLGDYNNPSFQMDARRIVDKRIDSHLHAGESFGFESTFSGASRPALVQQARRLGYMVDCVFFGTQHVKTNVNRVAARVETRRGHFVPEAEIRRRWHAVQHNVVKSWNAFNFLTIIDASTSESTIAAVKHESQLYLSPNSPPWLNSLLPQDLSIT